MKPKNKYERQILKFLQGLTDKFEVRRTRAGHIKATFNGTKRTTVVFCGSQSDHRSLKNTYSDARRALASAGLKPKGAS